MRDPFKNYHIWYNKEYKHYFEFNEFLDVLKRNIKEVAFYEGVKDYRNGIYKGDWGGRLFNDNIYNRGYNFAKYVIKTEKRLDLYLEINSTGANVFCEYYRFLNGHPF